MHFLLTEKESHGAVENNMKTLSEKCNCNSKKKKKKHSFIQPNKK